MTADYSKLAVYDINAYLWQKIQDAGLLNKNDYYVDNLSSYLVPIIPAQQIPEFNNLLPGKPYIVYDYVIKPSGQYWYVTEEVITYTILSQNYDQLNKILNFINDTFRRYDNVAREIDAYYAENSAFDFHYIYIDGIVSPQHFQNEGGFMIAEADIGVSYARKTDTNGRF
jgi:hypothetical protein